MELAKVMACEMRVASDELGERGICRYLVAEELSVSVGVETVLLALLQVLLTLPLVLRLPRTIPWMDPW